MKIMKAPVANPTMTRDFDELFERMLNTPFPTPLFNFEPFTRAMEGTWVPKLDLAETEKEFVIRAEVPGVPRENLDVNLEDNILTLTGHRENKTRETGETYLWEERETGRFIRTLRLPKAVDPVKVEAIYNEGILTVKLPKVETAIKNKIHIKV
jgi:HSP20 family protein